MPSLESTNRKASGEGREEGEMSDEQERERGDEERCEVRDTHDHPFSLMSFDYS